MYLSYYKKLKALNGNTLYIINEKGKLTIELDISFTHQGITALKQIFYNNITFYKKIRTMSLINKFHKPQ